MAINEDIMKQLYIEMIRSRKLDEKLIEGLYAGELITFFHSGQGQEAPGVALCAHLKKDDFVFYQHRGHGINKCLPRGLSPEAIIGEHYGKASGGANGFAGFHYAEPELGILGMGGMVGGELTLAVGAGITCKRNGKGQVVAACLGDGATGRGTFHEGMLMAATWKLPVIWFLENNRFQQWTCIKVSHPKEELVDFAHGYGIASETVDGQDVLAVYDALEPAIARARAGEGPTLLEINTLRFQPHAEGLPDYSVPCENRSQCDHPCEKGLRSEELLADYKKKDPIVLYGKTLIEKGILTEADMEKIGKEAAREMESARQHAIDAPYPKKEDLAGAMFAD